MRRLEQERRGQAVVELALVLSFLLLTASAVVQFGTLYGIKLRVEHAAREGASYGAIHAITGTDEEIRAHTIAVAHDLQPAIRADNIAIETPEGRGAKKPIVVTVVYPYSPTVPLISELLPETINIRATVQMRIEG